MPPYAEDETPKALNRTAAVKFRAEWRYLRSCGTE